MFSYQGLGEMTTIGKFLTSVLYGMSDDEKLYTYFEGCSDGGREGMSQIQRYGELYDGVVVGAPAFRYAQQQVNHVYPAMVEKDLNYFPPPCELSKIVNATIAACDSLDGRIDGVISRTDLCMLKFNLSSIIGDLIIVELKIVLPLVLVLVKERKVVLPLINPNKTVQLLLRESLFLRQFIKAFKVLLVKELIFLGKLVLSLVMVN